MNCWNYHQQSQSLTAFFFFFFLPSYCPYPELGHLVNLCLYCLNYGKLKCRASLEWVEDYSLASGGCPLSPACSQGDVPHIQLSPAHSHSVWEWRIQHVWRGLLAYTGEDHHDLLQACLLVWGGLPCIQHSHVSQIRGRHCGSNMVTLASIRRSVTMH